MNKIAGLYIIALAIVFGNGCDSSPSTTNPNQQNGQIAFTLSWPKDQKYQNGKLPSTQASITCEDVGVTTVSCDVYAKNGQVLASGNWPCEQKQGTLGRIPAAKELKVVLNARDGDEKALYRGVKEDVTVTAGQTNDLGIIELATVQNSPPTTLISRPQTEVVFDHGDQVSFEGSAEDPEDGTIDGADLVWSSNIDGRIGTGLTLDYADLSAGTHEITLTATDSDGAQGDAGITLNINAIPNVTIEDPEDGHNRCVGLSIRFSGSVNDPEDGDISDNGTLSWTSDRDGQIGTDSQFSIDTLSQGTHTIRLTAADSHQAQGTASVQVIVHAPRLADTGQTFSATSVFGEDSDYTSFLPAFTNNQNGTVTDDLTGLMWQQSDDGVTRPYHIALYEYAHKISLGGHSDWRLPSKKELLRIANYDRESPAINNAIFVNAKNGCYWTDSQYAGQVEFHWTLDFATGNVIAQNDTTECYARLVRRALDTPTSDFEAPNQETVIDKKTGLMWQGGEGECCWDWTGAIEHCEGLTLAGHSDWRLPNLKELESLVDDTKNAPAIDTDIFENTPSRSYWSSSARSADTHYLWKVKFEDGAVNHHSVEEEENNVRCVRDAD